MPIRKQLREKTELDPEGLEWATLSRLINLGGKRVLEVGCGDGRLTGTLAERVRYAVGIDPEEEAVAVARHDLASGLGGKLSLLVAEAEHLPFGDRSFDTAVFSWSL